MVTLQPGGHRCARRITIMTIGSRSCFTVESSFYLKSIDSDTGALDISKTKPLDSTHPNEFKTQTHYEASTQALLSSKTLSTFSNASETICFTPPSQKTYYNWRWVSVGDDIYLYRTKGNNKCHSLLTE